MDMATTKLDRIRVEKPWGLDALPPPFADESKARIGEIWFTAPSGVAMPLLVKYLFTSDKLSIQVHPNDEQARARGQPSGKAECWYILAAEPGALVGIGTQRSLSPEELRQASLSGAIEQLVRWHPVKPGMLFHIKPGTVHVIGAGVSLIEVQQNIDLTYRLYDYGRPRELHLEDGIAVSVAEPFPAAQIQDVDAGESKLLLDTEHFVLVQITGDDRQPLARATGWMTVIPVTGHAEFDNIILASGGCALVSAGTDIKLSPGAQCLVAWPKI